MPTNAQRLRHIAAQSTALQDAIEKHFELLVDALHARPGAQQLTTAAVNATSQIGCNLGHLALLATAAENLGEPDHPVIAEYYSRLEQLELFYETATHSGAVPYFGNYVVAPKGLRSLAGVGTSDSRSRPRSQTDFAQARKQQLDAETVLHEAEQKLKYLAHAFEMVDRHGSRPASKLLLDTLYAASLSCLAETVATQAMVDHPVLRARVGPPLAALDEHYRAVMERWNGVLLFPAPRTRQNTPRSWPPRSRA